jgi:hypothetical protein
MTKTRVLRGRIDSAEVKQLIVDDGIITRGYKVVDFHVFPGDNSVSNGDCVGTLALAERDCTIEWDASKQSQIGWASTYMPGTYTVAVEFNLIVPDHIVVRDLYVTGRSAAALPGEPVNYMITLEEVTITEDEAVMAILKEVQQDVADN